MKRNLLVGVAFVTAASLATAGPKGTIPKTSADLYLVHADHNGTRIGAALMSPDEVRRVFGFDEDRSCIIVEVALYPPDDKERKVLLSDFSLRIAGTDTAVKPSTATVVAANWRQQLRMQQDVKTELDGEVAFGPGLVHLEGQVRFEKVDSPAYPASEKEAATLEAELTDKGLPGGKTSSPVAGYLYFPVLQGKKHTTLQLDYETNGSSVILELSKPAGKSKNSSPLVAPQLGSRGEVCRWSATLNRGRNLHDVVDIGTVLAAPGVAGQTVEDSWMTTASLDWQKITVISGGN